MTILSLYFLISNSVLYLVQNGVCVCVLLINPGRQAAAHDSLSLCRRASRTSRRSRLFTLSLQMMM